MALTVTPESTYSDTIRRVMRKAPRKALGRVLWQLRHEHELTLDDIRKQTGIARSTLSRIENGRASPDKSTLDKLVVLYRLDGVGALYARAESGAPRMALTPLEAAHHASPGYYTIDAQTLSELSDLTARLARLVGRIEGRLVRSQDAPAVHVAAGERGAARPRTR